VPAIRTFHHGTFAAVALAGAKAGRTVSVVIPARDEERTIGDIVRALRAELVEAVPLVDEILVVDDRSTDGTGARAAEAGATVVASSGGDDGLGPAAGKGGALWKGVAAAGGDLLAFLDGDVVDLTPRFVVGLLGPLLAADGDTISLVKGFYERPVDGDLGGGRVTELTARPVLAVLLDHLSGVVQPLSGELAAPRRTLERLPFVEGYGVDLALLVDAATAFGVGSIVQVDLGRRAHRNRPLAELGPMATEVLMAALVRAGVAGPPTVRLEAPGGPTVVAHREHPPLVDVPSYRARHDRRSG
jgi:glucosyl-3-phosphoglycerate synthase